MDKNMSDSSIKARAVGLAELLRSGRYRVPWHQRKYVWNSEHVKTLLRDLEHAKDNKRTHFLGSIMLIEGDENRFWDVNDGQQRLITYSLLCASLCRLSNGQKAVANQMMRILFDIEEGHGESFNNAENLRLRIIPPEFDKINFKLLLQGRDVSGNGALVTAWNMVDEFHHSKSPRWRTSWAHFIQNNITVVRLDISQSQDATAIFETINNRGEKLQQSDLIRNYIFSFFNESDARQKREDVYDNFKKIENSFGKKIGEYLHCHLQAEYGNMPEGNLYKAVKGKYWYQVEKKAVKTRQKYMLNLTRKLAGNRCGLFKIVSMPNKGLDVLEQLEKQAGKRQQRMAMAHLLADLKGYSVTYPIVFSLLCRYVESTEQQQKENAKFAYECIQCLSSFTQRVVLTQKSFRPSDYQAEFANMSKDILQGRMNTVNALRDKLKSLTRYIFDDDECLERMVIVPLNKRKIKALLVRIVEFQQHETIVPPTEISVEHILPDSSKHLKKWPDISDGDHERYKDTLGNLTLLHAKDNQKASKNETFAKKVELYKKSDYRVTREICNYAQNGEWTTRSIRKRQHALAKIALKEIWKL